MSIETLRDCILFLNEKYTEDGYALSDGATSWYGDTLLGEFPHECDESYSLIAHGYESQRRVISDDNDHYYDVVLGHWDDDGEFQQTEV